MKAGAVYFFDANAQPERPAARATARSIMMRPRPLLNVLTT